MILMRIFCNNKKSVVYYIFTCFHESVLCRSVRKFHGSLVCGVPRRNSFSSASNLRIDIRQSGEEHPDKHKAPLSEENGDIFGIESDEGAIYFDKSVTPNHEQYGYGNNRRNEKGEVVHLTSFGQIRRDVDNPPEAYSTYKANVSDDNFQFLTKSQHNVNPQLKNGPQPLLKDCEFDQLVSEEEALHLYRYDSEPDSSIPKSDNSQPESNIGKINVPFQRNNIHASKYATDQESRFNYIDECYFGDCDQNTLNVKTNWSHHDPLQRNLPAVLKNGDFELNNVDQSAIYNKEMDDFSYIDETYFRETKNINTEHDSQVNMENMLSVSSLLLENRAEVSDSRNSVSQVIQEKFNPKNVSHEENVNDCGFIDDCYFNDLLRNKTAGKIHINIKNTSGTDFSTYNHQVENSNMNVIETTQSNYDYTVSHENKVDQKFCGIRNNGIGEQNSEKNMHNVNHFTHDNKFNQTQQYSSKTIVATNPNYASENLTAEQFDNNLQCSTNEVLKENDNSESHVLCNKNKPKVSPTKKLNESGHLCDAKKTNRKYVAVSSEHLSVNTGYELNKFNFSVEKSSDVSNIHKSTVVDAFKSDNKSANSDDDEMKNAMDYVLKMKKATQIRNSVLKDGDLSKVTGEKLDSKGFRILKNQVPDLSKLTREELLAILKSGIVYENENVVVLNKPYNLVVHDSKTNKEPSLSPLLDDLACLLDIKVPNPKLFTVHRLDKETTGCLLLARNEITAQHIKSLFAQRKIIKTYWVVTSKVPEPLEGVIDIPIAEGTIGNRTRMVLNPIIPEGVKYKSLSKHGKKAVTHYSVIATSGNAALVEVKPETGLKHQIRVHFGFGLGCPIIGDHKYSHLDKFAPQKLPSDLLQRLHVRQSKVRYIPLHIHARSIIVPEILDGQSLFAYAPMPHHMSKNLRRLKFKKK